MGPSTLAVLWFACLVGTLASDQEQQEKKAAIVKKFMKKHKKREGELRLVGGTADNEGNVEIFHLGRWGGVCDDEWDQAEAAVACRQLGYQRALRHTHSSHYGQTQHKYWLDNLYCNGSEVRLDGCRADTWGQDDCEGSEAAGVVCYAAPDANATTATPPTSTTDAKKHRRRIQDVLNQGRLHVRLAGGRHYAEGRVEVKYGDSSWGEVCGDGWSLLEASVVCRQLGLGYASAALQTSAFGGGVASDLALSGVECRGSEVTLAHCLHDAADELRCPGQEGTVAAVVCTAEMADLVIDGGEIERTAHLEDRQMYFLQCAMEENCLSSQAYKIQQEEPYTWHLNTRRLLRFTARILNAGTADFRPSVPKHQWEWHQCHMHYHSMEVFATFDIVDVNNVRVAEGHKASFCLEDNECLPGVSAGYQCANFGDQGISVNCSDIYRYNIDCQWIDITELTPGIYTFKVAVNPEFKAPEQSYDNNAAVCTMYYAESYVRVYDCVIQRP